LGRFFETAEGLFVVLVEGLFQGFVEFDFVTENRSTSTVLCVVPKSEELKIAGVNSF
jgi:hypothetical protein